MAGWKDNAAMYWMDGNNLVKVSDHNRSPLSESIERIEHKSRMGDGTLRRYVVAKKRTWTCSWDDLPSSNDVAGGMKTVDLGLAGKDLESFHNRTDGAFRMVLRRGSARDRALPTVADSALPYSDDYFYIVKVMITDFSKDVNRRGKIDFWNVDVTLEEV